MRPRLNMVEGVGDALRSGELAGMGGDTQPCIPGNVEGGGEVGMRALALVAAHAETGDQRDAGAG